MIAPPGDFIAGLVQLAVMPAAERDGELVADLEAQGSGLGKPQVMRIGRLPAADEAGLCGDKPQMGLVAQPPEFSDGENALVDPVAGTRLGEEGTIEVSADGRDLQSARRA